jgi:glycerol-3-phosphate cytidylyltransferase
MKIGFTASAFDLLHAGHIAMLMESRDHCDYLICGLQVDPSIDRRWKSRPVQSVVERYTQLRAVSVVDEIIPYCTEAELLEILQLRRIDVRFIGEEYKEKDFTGRSLCADRGIEIFWNSRRHGFSSSELRSRCAAGKAAHDVTSTPHLGKKDTQLFETPDI